MFLTDLFDNHPTLQRYWRTFLCFAAAAFLIWRGHIYDPGFSGDFSAPALCFGTGILCTFIGFTIFFSSNHETEAEAWDEMSHEAA